MAYHKIDNLPRTQDIAEVVVMYRKGNLDECDVTLLLLGLGVDIHAINNVVATQPLYQLQI